MVDTGTVNTVYAERRARVLSQLAPDSALLLAATPELLVGRDSELRYLVDADLYYLTGYTEPDAVALLLPRSDAPFVMFVRGRDAERELWTGKRAGVEGVRETFGVDVAYPITELAKTLPALLAQVNTVYARPSGRIDFDSLLPALFTEGRRARARSGRGPHIQRDPGDILDEMRLLKDAHEIELLRSATQLTAQAFAETLPKVRAGVGEWQIEAALEYEFRSRGATGPAFPSIVASGAHATTLHYIANSDTMQDGQLLLVDAGARQRMYCGDITRTVPVSGRFTARQRELYEIVLAAHDAAIAAVAPGLPVAGVHEAARAVLRDGLVRLRLLDGAEPDNAEALKRYFPHRTSHWLGLDVHDVGLYVRPDEPMLLQAGMVLTIEPGLYLSDEGVGIRIEDDVLVSERGHEVLTAMLPTDPREIEAMLR